MPNNEFGDFQTPLPLAMQCLRVLGIPHEARVLEPTCGTGAFLEASAILSPASERIGIERNSGYAAEAARWGKVREGNIFDTRVRSDLEWNSDAPLFVVGNPPWVTSAELNRMDSANLPNKENFKRVNGIDAMLGSSNFDVCEYIILKMLSELQAQSFTLGMLCKTQVARNVIAHAAESGLPVHGAAIYRIDAMSWFSAGVDSCWFVVAVDPHETPVYTVEMHDDVFSPGEESRRSFGVVDGLMVSDVEGYKDVREGDGECPFMWRSGLKHDASGVFELIATPAPATKNGDVLDLEEDYIYPFLKSTDVFRGRHRDLSKWVIVPQMKFGADTASLEFKAPKLWNYLNEHGEALDGRKSSIYRNRPRFSVFGHGDYTFASYKVAISGLHKDPVFALVRPVAGKPVVLDDTCYFLAFDDSTEASLVTAILGSPECRALIESMVFWDSKRPVTKKLLSRLDLNRIPVDPDLVMENAEKIAVESGVAFDRNGAESSFGRLGDSVPENALF